MKAEEKAKELYNEFYNTDSHGNSVKVRESLAKQCASIAVDEILKIGCIEVPYWQEVKKEINNI
jgi:hypothetical protein